MSSTSKPKNIAVIAAAVAGLAIAGAGGFAALRSGKLSVPISAANAKSNTAPLAGKVAASVNGEAIYDSELAPVVAQGVDRAIAVDRYVNKAIAADLAEKAYPKESEEAVRGAQREVLAQLYISKRTADLRNSLSEPEVKAYYDANVKAEDYTGYKVSFFVSQDPKEVDAMVASIASAIQAGKTPDVLGRFKAVKEGDGFTLAAELPYGLGTVVRNLHKGDFSKPIELRNGLFILHLEDTKPNPKPELAAVSEEIKNVLVAQKLTAELTTARQVAKVEVH